MIPAPPRMPRTTILGPISLLFVPAVLLTHGWLKLAILAVQVVLLVVQLVNFVRYQRSRRRWQAAVREATS